MIIGDNPIKYGTSLHSNRTKKWAFLDRTQTWYTCIALLNLIQTNHCESNIHCDCVSEWPQGRELGDLACSWWRSAADSHLHHSPQGFSAPICIITSKFKKYISSSDDLLLLDLSTSLHWFHPLYVYSILGDSY